MPRFCKANLSSLLRMLVAVWAVSCGKGETPECEKHIKEEIRVGVTVETAEAALKKCGFKTTVDFTKRYLYADKHVDGIVVSERTQIRVDFGADGKVVTVNVTRGLIGP